jgi:epoxyqueuosine reductase
VGTPLKQLILQEARRLGFVLAGVTTPDPPPHLSTFEAWLAQKRNASMGYLASERSRLRRADPRLILPECKSILVLAIPYSRPDSSPPPLGDREALPKQNGGSSLGVSAASTHNSVRGRIASYAWGDDYHVVLPKRLQSITQFIETQVGHPVANRWYTDTGPILERDLAQRAGLGWIGKNTCLIHPRRGSYFLLAEILLDLDLEPDAPFNTDHCGTCTRCLDACPTDCILADRTIDAGRCISYLTIELKDGVPPESRSLMDNWIFGCDICQEVCPWNRFAEPEGDPALRGEPANRDPLLASELGIAPAEFNRRFKNSPIDRARRRGYVRNLAVALGNTGAAEDLPALEPLLADPDPMIQEHAAWAMKQISERNR